jgi:hypothetical protein
MFEASGQTICAQSNVWSCFENNNFTIPYSLRSASHIAEFLYLFTHLKYSTHSVINSSSVLPTPATCGFEKIAQGIGGYFMSDFTSVSNNCGNKYSTSKLTECLKK